MPEYLKLTPPFEAIDKLLQNLPAQIGKVEEIGTIDAIGRVLEVDVFAPNPLPEFPRCTVDGYAVRSSDTFGASDSIPALLKLNGEVPMGKAPVFKVEQGTAVLIHTGGMIPDGADAVVMLEQTHPLHSSEIEILKAVSHNENVILAGEDVKTGDLVISAGTKLRIAEIGGLMSFGISKIKVAKKPLVGILSSGDEVVPADQTPKFGQVRDINSTTMSLIVSAAGGIPVQYGIVSDNETALLQIAKKAFMECDMVLVTAGSSASTRDLTSTVINQLGKPGVLVHGVSVRPGKPTILAVCDGKPVIGLPGNPVSAFVIAGIFVTRTIQKLLNQTVAQFIPMVPAELLANIPSVAGRDDWFPVRLVPKGNSWLAEPIYYKSNLIYNLVRADGLVHIQPDLTGIQAGETVNVEVL